MNGLPGALCLGHAGLTEVLAGSDRPGQLGRFDFGGARKQRVLVVAEPDGENLRARVAGGGSTGSGAHGHEVTVSQDDHLSQYDCLTSRIALTDFVRYDKSMTTTREPIAIDDEHPDFDHLEPAPDDAYAILIAHMLTGNELAVASIEVTP